MNNSIKFLINIQHGFESRCKGMKTNSLNIPFISQESVPFIFHMKDMHLFEPVSLPIITILPFP